MKYVISLFISLSVCASPIHLYYETNSMEANMLKDILINDYQIPEELISLKGIRECDEVKGGGKLDLCLKNNGDLLMVSVDRNFVNESLKVFKAH